MTAAEAQCLQQPSDKHARVIMHFQPQPILEAAQQQSNSPIATERCCAGLIYMYTLTEICCVWYSDKLILVDCTTNLAVELTTLCEVVIILSVVACHVSSDVVTMPCLCSVCLRTTE